MIRDEAIAKDVLALTENADALLMQSLALVREKCTQEESNQFRAAMAHVSGRLFFLVMKPIYCEHPDLAPPNTPREFRDSWNK